MAETRVKMLTDKLRGACDAGVTPMVIDDVNLPTPTETVQSPYETMRQIVTSGTHMHGGPASDSRQRAFRMHDGAPCRGDSSRARTRPHRASGHHVARARAWRSQ